MPFLYKSSACVVLGTFNMYIIKPPWLVEIGVVPSGTGVAIASNLNEPGFRYTPSKLAFEWFVTPGRIEFSTKSRTEDCGSKVGTLLENLPHTPLMALGNNASYFAPLADLGKMPVAFRPAPSAGDGYTLSQRSFHYGLEREGRVYNLQLSITSEDLELSVNVHTELRGKGTALAQSAARRYLDDLSEAESLLRELFATGVEHG